MATVLPDSKSHHKLSVGDKVEVKSLEEGFLGSWHAGEIIKSRKGVRVVKYDHLLNDEGTLSLVDTVFIKSATLNNFRGRIRPSPPFGEIERENIFYGLCVDALYNDAWWEGVIFDFDNGSDSRKVFFPDLGDEVDMNIKDLRITHDWVQFTQRWNPRGKWLFLEVIEEHTVNNLIPLSIKQIWYDLRERLDEIVDWACPIKPLWKNLVEDIVEIHTSLTLDAFVSAFDFSEDVLEDDKQIWLHDSKGVVSCEDIGPRNGDFVTENEERDPQNGDLVKENEEWDPRNGDLVTEKEEWDPRNSDLVIENEEWDPRNGDLVTENEECDPQNGDWVTEMEECDPRNGDLVLENEEFDPRNGDLVLENEECDPQNGDLVSENEEREPQNGDLITENEEWHPQNGDLLTEMEECDPQNDDLVTETEECDPQNGDLITENEERDLQNDDFATENEGCCPQNGDFATENEECDPQNGDFTTENEEYDPQNGDSITENEGWDPMIDEPVENNALALSDVCYNEKDSDSALLDPSNGSKNNKHARKKSRCELSLLPKTDKSKFKPVSYPESIDAYLLTDHPRCEIRNNVREHIYHLGWKPFPKRFGNQIRTRYKSPDGKIFYSLRSVCESFKPDVHDSHLNTEDGARKRVSSPSRSVDSLDLITKPNSKDLVVEPAYCPESVSEYAEGMRNRSNRRSNLFKEVRCKIRGHLSALGWKFYYTTKANGRFELRYKSRNTSKVYNTLIGVCHAIANGVEPNTLSEDLVLSRDNNGHFSSELLSVNTNPQRVVSPCNEGHSVPSKDRSEKSRKRKNGFEDQRDERNGVTNGLEKGVKKRCSRKTSKSFLPNTTEDSGKVKRRKLDGRGATRVNHSRKRVRQGFPSSFSQVPRTVLSWMIENNVVASRKKVYYRSRKDSSPIGEGKITRMGIKCICCNKVFALSSFAAHVGSNSCQPEANLFLEDGRSLMECQMEVISENSWLMSEEPLKVEGACRNRSESWNDHICSICHYGGELILCDSCPSSFHKDCLSLPEVPDGDWFCSSCCCGICGGSKFDVNSSAQFTDISVLCCEQCELQYHTLCIQNREMIKLDTRPTEKWFCSKTCEKVHWGLQQLIGKPILVGHNNLTWTMLKPIHYNDNDHFDMVNMARTNSKLNVALGVMHECFEPVKEPQTGRDLVEDVILRRRSELKRLNFKGFYTILLERDDELISVALLRVYGDKVAEIPLIGTRFQHRRLGMCRILMNEIEKNLMNLGVEKLVLPAASSVLNTWTSAFGFSQVTKPERSKLLCYTFLDFQDTIMCEKLLKKRPSPLSNLVRDVNVESSENAERGIVLLESEGNSGISEVYHEEQAEGSDSVNQVAQVTDFGDKRSADGDDHRQGSPVPMVTEEPINKERKASNTTALLGQTRVNPGSENSDRSLIFYKRKKTGDSRSSSTHQVDYPKVEVICR